MTIKKITIALAFTALSLALLAGIGTAQADGGNISFGIRPATAQLDRPETFSYFVHELKGGAIVHDAVLVLNSGDVPVTLKLFAAEAFTAVNGGTAFARQGEETNGVSRWLSLDVEEVFLAPGDEKVVPFTIGVPSDVSPGQYVTGLVVELAPSAVDLAPADAGKRQFTANVARQAGVAVVIDVPGLRVAGLEITGASLKQQGGQGATFVIAVHNTGNTLMKAGGSLTITDREGKELASIPLAMGTVLPGDTTTFQVTHPVDLADGRYLLDANLEYADDQVASLKGAEVKVKDGQPEVKREARGPDEPTVITKIIGSPAESKFVLVLVVVVASMAVMGVVALAVQVRRRSLRRKHQLYLPPETGPDEMLETWSQEGEIAGKETTHT